MTLKKIKFEQLLLKLTAAVSYHYNTDPIKPGLVFSMLKNNECYCSIVRYGKTSQDKIVIFSAKGPSFKNVLDSVAIDFLNMLRSLDANPIDEFINLAIDTENEKMSVKPEYPTSADDKQHCNFGFCTRDTFLNYEYCKSHIGQSLIVNKRFKGEE